MPPAAYYAGPDPGLLESLVFERAADTAAEVPGSVLYLAPNDIDEDAVRDRWSHTGAPLQLTISGFDDLVRDAYEQHTYRGAASTMPLQVRYRLVEIALSTLSDSTNPLTPTATHPGPGLTAQAEDLLSLLEFAGLLTPEAVEDRLQEPGLPEIATQLAALTETFQHARAELVDDPEALSLRSERYATVVEQPETLHAILDHVDVIILGPFTIYSPLETALIEILADSRTTFAILPQHNDTDTPTGVDATMWRAKDAYDAHKFTRHYEAPTPDAQAQARQRLTSRLYRFDETGRHLPQEVVDSAAIEWRTYPTPEAECTGIAQDLRHRLTEDALDSSDVGIVTASPSEYTQPLVESLRAHRIPVATTTTLAASVTALGALIESLLDIATPDATAPETYLGVLENPLVDTTQFLATHELARLRTAAANAETNSLATLLTQVETSAPIQAALDDLDEIADTFSSAQRGEYTTAFKDVCDAIGLSDERFEELAAPLRTREQTAKSRIEDALESLDETAGVGPGIETRDAIRRALAAVSISVDPPRDDAHVTITTLSKVPPQRFDHVYVVGLTSSHFPSNQARLEFFRAVNEAHADFAETDTPGHARLGFATLLTTSTTTVLSNPERSLAGDPYNEADVLAELRRVTGLEPEQHTDTGHQPGTPEAQHTRLAHTVAKHDDPATPISDAQDALAVPNSDAVLLDRLRAGAQAATARANDEVTEYDGLVGADVANQLHPMGAFSPSRLEKYAACGFKYYMSEVLDIESPDEYTLDPDARDKGGFIHNVLERYYKSLQEHNGQPVEPDDSPRHREALLDAAITELERFDEETPFHEGWLTQVFAGLDPLERNPYPVSDGDRGLLVHFLEMETDGRTTGWPAYFEGRVGNPRSDDETVLQPDPITVGDEGVSLKGAIDRLDFVPNTDPPEVVAYDYKTGSTPSARETLEGLRFQLPVYLLLADTLLDDVAVVGASYYQVKPPTTASYGKGQIGSTEDGEYARSGSGALSYWRKPDHDTREEFHEFLIITVLENISQIATGVESGVFEPALIDPGKAGCRHCEYRDVCDVRSHRRRDIIHHHDTEQPDIPVYIPEYARDLADTEASDD